uniref:Uncharacterized protein n=1 Tax=Arundo donax TaxID=35708 RepID=A0A0A9TFC9_ARUDO
MCSMFWCSSRKL